MSRMMSNLGSFSRRTWMRSMRRPHLTRMNSTSTHTQIPFGVEIQCMIPKSVSFSAASHRVDNSLRRSRISRHPYLTPAVFARNPTLSHHTIDQMDDVVDKMGIHLTSISEGEKNYDDTIAHLAELCEELKSKNAWTEEELNALRWKIDAERLTSDQRLNILHNYNFFEENVRSNVHQQFFNIYMEGDSANNPKHVKLIDSLFNENMKSIVFQHEHPTTDFRTIKSWVNFSLAFAHYSMKNGKITNEMKEALKSVLAVNPIDAKSQWTKIFLEGTQSKPIKTTE